MSEFDCVVDFVLPNYMLQVDLTNKMYENPYNALLICLKPNYYTILANVKVDIT